MRDELNTSTAIRDGIVAVPDSRESEAIGGPSALLAEGGSNLPHNEPGHDQINTPLRYAQVPNPDSTGPPDAENTADYWFALISEKPAAKYLGMTDRWLQAKRQHGGGPKFIRISRRCIRYRRADLKEYADRHLRSSTSDHGESD